MNLKKLLAAMAALVSLNANAELKIGDIAPDFTTQASLGGKVYSYTLYDALKNGPVVLYFYPAAFTPGCTIEAHNFAEAIEQFGKFDATVIGVSHDPIEKLQKFSVSECRGKFPVAADADGAIMKAYDATMPIFSSYASRTSYVIAQDHKVVHVYSSLSPDKHVENTLAAVKRLKEAGH